ncbi:MAG: NADH-quinone oxidoreductase subunit NuoH [Chloroflexi bacterium]|nr:NADH-quinone oxidoreductase subunit NuoH [Chloroflexota bacterium]
MGIVQSFQNWLGGSWPGWAAYLVAALVGAIVLSLIVILLVMAFAYMERRVIGRFQIRLGPNRTGPQGTLQLVADAIKMLLKEDIVPSRGDRLMHALAPVISFMPALLVFAVIPFQSGVYLVDLNVGILYVVAIGTVSMMGVFMAGWSSNNKYSLLAAMRAVAQMVSYELPLVLSIIGVLLISGSLSLVKIVEAQSIPFILLQPLGFLIFFIGASAELNRSPFDLLEAESEIVSGYHTEYSGMKFGLFLLGEYGHALGASAIMTTLFLGGWRWALLPGWLWFLVKVVGVYTLLIWTRATLPRFRVDQLMGFAWKALFPMALLNMFITGAEVLWAEQMGWSVLPWPFLIVNFAVAGVLIVLWSRFFKTGGGRVEVRA